MKAKPKTFAVQVNHEPINLLLLLGIFISLIGTLIGASDTFDFLRFFHPVLVPHVYRINAGVKELSSFPPGGKHAALSKNETGFKEILEIIRNNDSGVPKGLYR